MNILLNLIAIKKGGGQQVATTFLDTVLSNEGLGHSWYVVATKDSEVHGVLKKHKYVNYQVINNNVVKRLFFEAAVINRIIKKNKIDVVYTYGPALFFNIKIPVVIRSAYSNLYFPEIKFWVGYSLLKTLHLKLQDIYRLQMTLRTNGLIVENESMRERALELFDFTEENTIYIKSSVTAFTRSEKQINFIPEHQKNNFKVLLLTGWHRNKNLHLLPDILKSILNKHGRNNISFFLSINENLPEAKQLIEKARNLGVSGNLFFIGSIKSEHIHLVYDQTDVVLLLSLLECFSNNIIEAWHFKRPLVISNEPWARAICKDSAIYVNRNDPEYIADKLVEISNSSSLYSNTVAKGLIELESYNTPLSKARAQVDFLQKIAGKYSLPV